MNFHLIVSGIVRRYKNMSDSTDEEIYTVMKSWFRFTKDRDGGRDARRKKSISS